MGHKFYLAPLRGITDKIFRGVYEARFGRFDYMLAPFVPTILGKRVREHHIRDLLPGAAGAGGGRLIPQIIGRDPEGFLPLSRGFAELGFPSVNWNLGCPAPQVAKKKRGCGLLPHTDIIKRFLDETVPKLPLPLSIKARLGYESPRELEALIPLFNDYPLEELIIHPRTGIQLYGGEVDINGFEACLNMSRHPVAYNGDIVSVAAFKRLTERFPNVSRWMTGRGVVMNPFLLRELRAAAVHGTTESTGTMSSVESVGTVEGFLNDLLEACEEHRHPIKTLGKMKEIWGYLGRGIAGWEEAAKRVIRCKSLEEYRGVIDGIETFF
jgi:tRNA-dihydrouridine synthase